MSEPLVALKAALEDYEQWWFGQEASVVFGAKRMTIEVNPDGKVVRRVVSDAVEQKNQAPNAIGPAASYGFVNPGQIFQIHDQSNLPPKFKKSPPGIEFLPDATTAALMEKMIGFPRSGFFRGSSISDLIQDCGHVVREDAQHEGDGLVAIDYSCDDLPMLTFWLDKHGRLAGLDITYRAGDRLPDGTQLPKGKVSKTLLEVYYENNTDKRPNRLVTKARDTSFEGESTQLIEFRDLDAALPPRITLPDFDCSEGMFVACAAQPGNEFQLRDGLVVPVVDGMTLDEIDALRWRSRGGGRFIFWSVLSLLLFLLTAVFLWQRSRRQA